MKTLLVAFFMVFVSFNAFAIEEKLDAPECEKLVSESREEGKSINQDDKAESKEATASEA